MSKTVIQHSVESLPVDRRAGLSLREFRREYLYPGRPVVITDAMDKWRARSHWTLDFFRSKYGNDSIEVHRFGRNGYKQDQVSSVKLADHIDAIEKHDWTSYPYYVRDDWNLMLSHRELLADYKVPPYFFDWFAFVPSFMRLIYPRIFIGPRGAITPLHHDVWGTHAWLSQIVGRKRWFLFSPDQRSLLYDYKTRVCEPDFQTFPLLAKARAMECTIAPGDTIFVPGGWSHEVVSLDATLSLTHNYMGPGCFRNSFKSCVNARVLPRLWNRTKIRN
jgi:ribosomal protein L16 Arg81 hydroxylase